MKTMKVLSSIVLGAMMLGSGAVFATSTTSTTTTTDATASGDYTRKELASALINYEAASRMQDYMRDQQLMFMSAPATIWAIQAGAVIGAANTSAASLKFADKSLVNSLGGLTKASKVTIHGAEYPVPTERVGPLGYYDSLKSFFESGEAKNLSNISIASLMQADNLTASNSGVTPDQAQSLVNILADPFPNVDPTLSQKIKGGQELTGQDMEKLGSKVASYAIIGVSAMALSDIIARRIPTEGQQKSVMEVMDDASKDRITKTDWYNEVGAASEAALLREIAHMMAYNQWMAYEQFKVSEQQLAVLASLNAVMAKTNAMIDQLNSQLSAAQAQAQSANAELQQKLNQLDTSPVEGTTTPVNP